MSLAEVSPILQALLGVLLLADMLFFGWLWTALWKRHLAGRRRRRMSRLHKSPNGKT